MHNHFKIQASSVLCGNGVRSVICDNFKIQASCVFWDNAVRPVKYHTVRTVPISYSQIVDRGKIDIPNTHAWPLTFLAWYRHFNKKCRGQTSFSEIKRSCKWFLHVNNVIFFVFVDFGTVQTVWYFSIRFWNCSTVWYFFFSRFWTVQTVW
jgi:hypothetical protein